MVKRISPAENVRPAMVSVVSRATRAMEANLASAQHEVLLASSFCEQGFLLLLKLLRKDRSVEILTQERGGFGERLGRCRSVSRRICTAERQHRKQQRQDSYLHDGQSSAA